LAAIDPDRRQRAATVTGGRRKAAWSRRHRHRAPSGRRHGGVWRRRWERLRHHRWIDQGAAGQRTCKGIAATTTTAHDRRRATDSHATRHRSSCCCCAWTVWKRERGISTASQPRFLRQRPMETLLCRSGPRFPSVAAFLVRRSLFSDRQRRQETPRHCSFVLRSVVRRKDDVVSIILVF
jgi:hypothetical protein